MITKNKQTPNTLYLLNKNLSNKNEEQRKSARLSFNKKKSSSRSISQYQKWNPVKEPSTVPFQPVTRTNSEIKRIFLNKNQFALESLPIEKKLGEIVDIFGKKQRMTTQQAQAQRGKSRDSKSGEMSLLSVREESKQRAKSHVRMQSMANNVGKDAQSMLQSVLSKVEHKFRTYQDHSEEWKMKYLSCESDYFLDQIVRSFKGLIYQVIVQFRNALVENVEYCERAVVQVAREYEREINSLKVSMTKMDQMKQTMENLYQTLKQSENKNIVCTLVWEELQKRGVDMEEVVRQSGVYEKLKHCSFVNPQKVDMTFMQNSDCHNEFSVGRSHSREMPSEMSSKSNQGESRDLVQEQNWDQKFQDNQRIKGVLKYIHNNNKQEGKTNNYRQEGKLNSTGLVKKKSQMKIQNWQSFQKRQRHITNFNKILSQR